MTLARPAIDAALRRLCVDLEHPTELDEWRPGRWRPRRRILLDEDGCSLAVPASVYTGAVSVRDKHGRDLRSAA